MSHSASVSASAVTISNLPSTTRQPAPRADVDQATLLVRRRLSVHQLISVNGRQATEPPNIPDTIARFDPAVARRRRKHRRTFELAQRVTSPNQRAIVRGDLAGCEGAADLIDDLLQLVEVIGDPVGQLRMFC